MGDIERRKFYLHLKMESTAWLSLLLAVLAYVTPVLSSSPRVVCYYTNWSVYRPGTAKFNPQNINPYLCTHLVYAFGGFTKENSLKPFDKYQDVEKGGYAKFNGLKTYNKNLKTLLAIGGWNEGSSRFSPMVGARDRRKEFVKNAIKFLRQNQFDGLDLDWEYPASRDGGKPKDRENYAKLVKELREEFERESEKTGKPRLLLTMAVPAGIEYIQKGFDVATLNRYLDWMNLLTYDYHSAFEPAVNHHAPLFPLEEPNEYSVDNELNIDYTIKFYLENGADRDKLVLGIPTYGRSYTLFNPDAVEIGSPADGPGEQGDATREKGYLAYYEICEALKPKTKKKRSIDSQEESEEDSEEEPEEEWTVMHPNPSAMGPVAFRGNQWVGYDDIEIVKKKAEYVAENGLGGIMFWSIDNDDFRGTCHGKPYPLIEAAKEAYIVKLGSTDNAIVTDKPKPRSSSGSRRRSKPRSSSTTTTTPKPTTTAKSNKRKSSSSSSTTPSWNIITPEPPTTPDPGSDFKCTDEGFFPHPRDCKKYFWCLDSGPSNLGIVAHQFTCPSGLFFNKAADSCDFARNVLCKVKTAPTTKAPKTTKATTSKATVASTTTTTTTTTRRPIRLTSRSSLLFRTTSTTTPVPEVVDESEEEEEEEGTVPEDTSDVDAEDPRVIKELIDLIKKVGGVEQLEKQLQLSESSGARSTSGVTAATTPTPFNKRLYQKVLERTRGQNRFGNSVNSIEGTSQNSRRAPQNAGLEPDKDKDKLLRKDRPQYTTINRSRPSTTQEPEASEELEEESAEEVPLTRARAVAEPSVATTARPLQYVNIRRARPTTVAADDDASRNALFERLEPYSAVSETANSLDIASARRESIPEYVTIRRTRPTTEETTTVQYKNSEHEEESQETALEREISSPSSQPQYTSIIRTRSTTLPPPEELSSPEPTTVLSVQISSLLNSPNSAEVESPAPETTAAPTEPEPTTVSSTTTTTTTTTTSPTTTAPSSLPTRRNLLRRRGSTSTTTTTAPVSSTQAAKERRPFLRRTKATAPPDAADSETTTDNIETTTNKYTKRGNSKFKTPKDADKDSAVEKTRETGENQTRTRQPSFSNSAARSDRPTRNFVRRRLGGANSSSTTRSTSALAASAATRRPFRVASRRRPVSTVSTSLTTSLTTLSTASLSTTTTTQSAIDLGSEELLQDIVDIGDIDSIEDPTLTTGLPRNNAKVTRRPLVSLKDEDQNPSATNEDERKRQSKKYSATFKQNQLDKALRAKSREEDAETTTEGKTTIEDISAETAVALAAHQLLAAPVPIIPDYDDVKPTKKTQTTTNLDYKYTNPTYTDDYKQTYTEQYSNTPTYQEYGQTTAYTGTNTNPVTDIFARVSRPGYSNLLNPTISGPNVGVDGSTARYSLSDTNAPTTYEYTTRSRGYSANLITPTASGVTINVGEDLSTRYTATDREIPTTFPTIFTSKVSRPSGFTAPVTTPTSFRDRSTGRYQVSERIIPSTGRYQSEDPIPVPVDFGYSTDGYSPSQEPSYFTREYLLESPVTKAYDDEYQYLSPITSPQTTPTTTATKPPKKKVVFRKISTTQRPTTPASSDTTTLKPRRVATRKPFQKIQKTQVKDENRTYRPIANYDYYDDSNEKMAGKYDEGAKVILHGKDSIECLDIGNFPHPTSCKKFISCARIDNGSLLGWEYVCPKGLSFDPVGGICNWAAGLGCGEKDV